MPNAPAFGQADLSNCERELIHLAGSIQPHGALLVIDPANFSILQASANCPALLGTGNKKLLGRSIAELDSGLAQAVQEAAPTLAPEELRPMNLQIAPNQGQSAGRKFDAVLHRGSAQELILELEALDSRPDPVETVSVEPEALVEIIAAAIQRIGAAGNEGLLFDIAVQVFRDLVGYDRVMAYKFDPDGHGKIIAEARHPRLDSLLGHRYPASDIPQRARDLYLRTRVRVLVDVHYTPVPIEPRLQPRSGQELDMSLCHLRSMSPLHIQYLKNMGVNATLVISLVREGRLWGLIACHHDTPRNLRYPVRAACELLAEVIAMRLAAIENYAHAQVDLLVRRLEQRLIEATSVEGDWRMALFRNPRTLLQPLDATGAALAYEGEILTGGEVPSSPELRALIDWIASCAKGSIFSCSSVARENAKLQSLTPTASGVLAISLSDSRPDYLLWFRKEQLQSVTWAGDPSKPVVRDDPLELSPRRSFAAWSEIVRGTAAPWTKKELLFARAIGSALIDIVAQVNAVRMLIAEHQIAKVRATIASSKEAVLVAGYGGPPSYANPQFCAMVGRDTETLRQSLREGIEGLAVIFGEAALAANKLRGLASQRESWRGKVEVLRLDGSRVPASVRAEAVPGSDGNLLGFLIVLVDRSEHQRAAAAMLNLERSISRTSTMPVVSGPEEPRELGPDPLIGSLLTNASMAAMDIADATSESAVAPILEELETSLQRATALYNRIRSLAAVSPSRQ